MRKRFISRDIDALLRIVYKDVSARFQIQSYEIVFSLMKTFYRLYAFSFSLKADFLMYGNLTGLYKLFII